MVYYNRKTIYEVLGRETVHPFPARMAPGIALDVLANTKKKIRILDPMMGSGTVIAVARSKGHQAFGVDIDPLAVLIAKVWSTVVNVEDVRRRAADVLVRARGIFASLPLRDAYPLRSDPQTRRFIRYWFDGYARRQLTALSIAITHVRDNAIRNTLWCGFSRLIITKQAGASLAMDLSHSRPHKYFDYAPVKPFHKFLPAVNRVVENCIGRNCTGRGPAPCIHEGDARSLPLSDDTVDLVLTSPPYLNAIDYLRCSKFSLVWMGYSIIKLRHLRSNSVGTEIGKYSDPDNQEIQDILTELRPSPKLAPRDEAALMRYIDDMRRAVREVARVLTPGGRVVYVVGENTVRGTQIRTAVIISALAGNSGLKFHKRQSRMLPANRRYLPPPSKRGNTNALNIRIRREVILSFKKPFG